MYEFWYDYVKPRYGKKAKLCYMDTDSFIVCKKTDDIDKDIAEAVEARFDASNYELERNSIERLFPRGKNKKTIGLIKYELGRKIRTKFIGLRAKTYSYLIDKGREDKKAEDTKKCVINCLEATQLEHKIIQKKIDIDRILFSLKKLTRLFSVQMMIKESNELSQ